MFDDPERYEHDGFYEEDTDYEDEYEADDSDYIVDDEENENALWDDEEEEPADDLPEKKRRKRKNQVVLADNDTDTEETELSEQVRRQITKEKQLIEELEADAEEHPFEDVLTRKNWSVRSSNENCGQKPLHDWRIPPEHSGSLKM